jgi:hypothetical protein
MTTTQTIHATIIDQLGRNMFAMMTGAKFYKYNDVTLCVKFKGSRKATLMYIAYNEGADLYDIKFKKLFKGVLKTVAEFDGIYNDQLTSIFEDFTGLRTRLF